MLAWLHAKALNPEIRAGAKHKDGAAIIPAEFRPSPFRSDGLYEGKDGASSAVPYRHKDNVGAISAIVIDLDKLESADAINAYFDMLRGRGLGFLAYPTFRCTAAEPRWRVVFTLSEPVRITHPDQWRDHLWPAFMRHVLAPSPDPKCKDPARLYYLPSRNSASSDTYPAPILHAGADINAADVIATVTAPRLARIFENVHAHVKEPDGPPTDITDRAEIIERLYARFKEGTPYRTVIDQAIVGDEIRHPQSDADTHDGINALAWALACIARPGESTWDLMFFADDSLQKMDERNPSRGVIGEFERGLRGARFELAKRAARDKRIEEILWADHAALLAAGRKS